MEDTEMSKQITLLEAAVKAPAAFALRASPDRSERFAHVQTSSLVKLALAKGWYISHADQTKVRKTSAMYARHLIKLRHPAFDQPVADLGGVIPELALMNAHNGTSSLRAFIGAFRLACSNGLLILSDTLAGFTLAHRGKDLQSRSEELLEASLDIVPDIIGQLRDLQQIELDYKQRVQFALQAATLRFPAEKTVVNPRALLRVHRPEDDGNDLWTVYNVVQENLLNGGFTYYKKAANDEGETEIKDVRARPIRSVSGNTRLNLGLWNLTREYAEAA